MTNRNSSRIPGERTTQLTASSKSETSSGNSFGTPTNLAKDRHSDSGLGAGIVKKDIERLKDLIENFEKIVEKTVEKIIEKAVEKAVEQAIEKATKKITEKVLDKVKIWILVGILGLVVTVTGWFFIAFVGEVRVVFK